MTLTLSIDHRAVEAAAAAFLTTVRELIERPLASRYDQPFLPILNGINYLGQLY